MEKSFKFWPKKGYDVPTGRDASHAYEVSAGEGALERDGPATSTQARLLSLVQKKTASAGEGCDDGPAKLDENEAAGEIWSA